VDDLSLIELALSAVEGAGDYLRAYDACEALAACEVLARLREFGYEWVSSHPIAPSAPLLSRACGAIDRILGENSELRQLWDDSGSAEWIEGVEDLRRRLQA
jgi:hypothetical protein